jgi:hypothetical protein
MSEFEPNIIIFLCNVSYAGADLAGAPVSDRPMPGRSG